MVEMKGPPSGFGKSVNDYLNDYVRVADAKATAFLAANLAAATLVLRLTAVSWLPSACRWLSLASFAASTCFCAWTVFPRLPKGHMGLVFWEDIMFFKSADLYRRELASIDDAMVESEYATQNWFASAVVHKKMLAVRRAIISFLVGLGLAVASYLSLP